MTATISRSEHVSTFPSSMRQRSGFQASTLSKSSDLSAQSVRFQSRSSSNQLDLRSASRNIAQNNIIAIFRGRNPRVTQFAGSRGQQEAPRVQSMHRRGKWEFGRDGQFRFTPRGLGTIARTDLFPIVGRYKQQGNTIRFSGSRSSGNLGSVTTSSIRGRFILGRGQARIVQKTSRNIAAEFGGGTFGSNSNSIVYLNLRMVRIR